MDAAMKAVVLCRILQCQPFCPLSTSQVPVRPHPVMYSFLLTRYLACALLRILMVSNELAQKCVLVPCEFSWSLQALLPVYYQNGTEEWELRRPAHSWNPREADSLKGHPRQLVALVENQDGLSTLRRKHDVSPCYVLETVSQRARRETMLRRLAIQMRCACTGPDRDRTATPKVYQCTEREHTGRSRLYHCWILHCPSE